MKFFKNYQIYQFMIIFSLFKVISNDGFLIKKLNNFEEYKKLISNNKLSCIIFYDSLKCDQCDIILKKLIQELENSQINRNFKIEFFIIDISSSNSFRENLFIKEITFHFYIEQEHLKEMEDFKEIFENVLQKDKELKNLSKEVESFLTTEINNFTEEINELEEIQNLIDKKNKNLKKFSIYLGKKNKNFKTYQESTLQDINYNYYHSFNEDIKKFIEESFKINFSNNDIVAVISKKKKRNIIKYLKIDKKTNSHISRFLSFEKFPKIRGEQYLSYFNEYLYKDKNFILLYIKPNKENKQNQDNLIMYKEIVKKLPKGFIYCYSSLSEDLKLNLGVFFKIQGILPQADSLYIMYNIRDNIFINKMEYAMEKNFVISFLKNHVLTFKSILRNMQLNEIVDYFENEDFKSKEL